MKVSVFSVFLTAGLPVVNVFLMCALGAALSWKGILDRRGRHLLSQLVFWIFVPALTFVTLGDAVNLQNLAVWWILPVNVLVSILLGLVVGWLFARLFNIDPWFQKHFMCCSALGNVGNLPLVLVSSVCTAKTPFRGALGDQCERLGIAYVAFAMWVASMFQYCVAFNLLKPPTQAKRLSSDEEKPLGAQTAEVVLQMTTVPRKEEQSEDMKGSGSNGVVLEIQKNYVDNAERAENPLEEAASSPEEWDAAVSREEEEGALLPSTQSSPLHQPKGAVLEPEDEQEADQYSPSAAFEKGQEVYRLIKGVPWASYLNCPTLAAIAGLTVGCVSILKRLLFGNAPPLFFVTQSLETMAGGMIPCMMLILGGSLAEGPGVAKLPWRVVAGSILVRLLLIPAVGTGFVLIMLKVGAIQPPDILFTLTLLLCHAPPSAMNLQAVATLNRSGEAEISLILCWQYLAALITLPLWMSLFVYIVTTLP